MRLIDADTLMKRLKAWDTTDATDKALYNFTLHRILEQSTIEPQPDIIHCGECKYYHDSDGCFFSTATTGADGFCHWAERKEGEADESD